ncbi:MAG TPA: YwiC-like family protein [Fimbriimonadaceae bacterium]|nr:YwiC-like family protein [Fimbriimonadaceae bacterium]
MQNVAAQLATRPQPTVRLKPIALPSEHGGWGMLGAPILLGLLVAPSWPGLFLGLAALAAFLTRQPFRLAIMDLRKGKRYPRTAWALRFAIGYGLVGLLALAEAAIQARATFWLPLGAAALLGGIQFAHDIQGKGRSFVPEACGAASLASVATAIAIAGGFLASRSWLLAAALALQAATAISYAAARVRLARGVEIALWPVWAGSVAALATITAITSFAGLAWPATAAFAVLAARSAWGLSSCRMNVRAAIVGLQEVGYTLMTVVAIYLSVR